MNHQTARLIEQLLRMFRSGGSARWLAIAIAAGVMLVVVLQPQWLAGPEGTEPDGTPTRVETDQSYETTSVDDRTTADPEATAGPSRGSRANSTSAEAELTSLPGDAYRSPAGLVYTRGSRHGHRLKHVLAHGQDEANRPGPHGVFQDGSQAGIVGLLDEAYRKAQQGGRDVRRRQEDQRVVLTIDMGRVIGYVGGQTGNRRGRPTARHLRMVLEDERVITAYPVAQ